jgi:hypothetical protein
MPDETTEKKRCFKCVDADGASDITVGKIYEGKCENFTMTLDKDDSGDCGSKYCDYRFVEVPAPAPLPPAKTTAEWVPAVNDECAIVNDT